MIVTLARAKQQLGIDDNDEDDAINALILQAVALVCADLGRDVYETALEVPENAEAPIVLEALSPLKKASLDTAVLLMISHLHTHRDKDLDAKLSLNSAYTTALKPFVRVLIG